MCLELIVVKLARQLKSLGGIPGLQHSTKFDTLDAMDFLSLEIPSFVH